MAFTTTSSCPGVVLLFLTLPLRTVIVCGTARSKTQRTDVVISDLGSASGALE